MFEPEWIGRCQGPVWQVDDISECVQHDYFQIIFPLSAVIISLLLLLSLALQDRLSLWRRKTSLKNYNYSAQAQDDYQSLTQTNINQEDHEHLVINDARLILTQSNSKLSVAAIDVPRGQRITLIVEILTILALDALSISGLVFLNRNWKIKTVAIVGIIIWTYVGILVASRFVLLLSNQRNSSLWNHTGAIYASMWVLLLPIFRSTLIHPPMGITNATRIAEFILVSVLFLIAITTRRGNKIIVLEWENDLKPSKEPLASILSLATFSWVDSLVWEGYKKTFELSDVWNLVPRDRAEQVLADYRQLKKTTTLSWHLLGYFKKQLVVQCMFAIISSGFTFAPTLLLRSILEYIEDPTSTPRNVIWLYIILLAFTDILRSLADGQALWIGRKICIQFRAIIIGQIYSKALRRKAASTGDTVLGDRNNKSKSSKPSLIKKVLGLGKKEDNEVDSDGLKKGDTDDIKKPKDEQVNTGTIINLMSVDAFHVSEVTSYLHYLLAAAPSQLILAIYLLYQILGYSSIPGLVMMVILLPLNVMLARGFNNFQSKVLAATDKRIHITNEVLQNIRIIKYFAWEQRFAKKLDEKRSVELGSLKSKFILWAFAVAIWNTVPITITFFSFLIYTVVEGKPLYPSIAFTSISLFSILRVPLDQLGDMIAHVLESKVSVDRVEEFLNEEETSKYDQLRHDNLDEEGNIMIGFKKATISWGIMGTDLKDSATSFSLIDLDIKFEIGKLNIVAGPTGSGKSSLLLALLGEMTLICGKVFSPGGYSREDIRPDPKTGLAETVAYCAQQAWLVNANIKDNILFSTPYNKRRYDDVIYACALERDLQILNDGDETLVGEKGVTVSGGQKQRISLARAIYSNSRHVFLDDCLSAVDSHTAKWIFDKCIRGPLMHERTCILVTHNLSLCVPQSHYVVILENGKVNAQGKSNEVIASQKFADEFSKSNFESDEALTQSLDNNSGPDGETKNTQVDSTSVANNSQSAPNNKDGNRETRAEGGVKLSVVGLYLKSMGPWWFWVVAITIFGFQQFGVLGANAWIRQWANQYSTGAVRARVLSSNAFSGSSIMSIQSINPQKIQIPHYLDPKKKSVEANSMQDVNVTYYLAVYAAIGLSCMLVALFRDLWLFYGSLTASWRIHKHLVQSIIRAKLKFFDVTPLGQIMNRFSKDLEGIDQEVAPVSIGMMSCALSILVTISLISIITPSFLIAATVITCMYFFVGMIYIKSSSDLKRLESVQRSPLFQHFGETLSGITTIRAYGHEKRFSRDNMHRINTLNRPFISLWAANRWMSFRMDMIGDFVAFAAGAFVMLSIGRIDAGSAGLSLSYAISFTENVIWLVRLYSLNEQNMNSVERIKEYLEVEQEAQAVIDETKPSADWPSQGSVEFINYSTRYRSDLDPVLKNISFQISPGEKVGVVGRTGAGKSSLALALFRGLEAEEGKILIDGLDIGLIGLQHLRESITMVPQDPTLFSGTIRNNLDPFDIFNDEDIFNTLRRVHLIDKEIPTLIPSVPLSCNSTSIPENLDSTNTIVAETSSNNSTLMITNKNIFLNLSSPVTNSGSNLSQGQRQLLCLARALLKNPKVLLMDEATASIDYSTDSKIQETIRELKSTIITIAHRLQTIVDYDKVLVLDHGEVVEFGHPWLLLREESDITRGANWRRNGFIRTGMFKKMCETSGDFDTLMKTAKEKWNAGRLIDDE